MNMNIMNMKTRSIAVVSAVAVSCLTLILSNTAVAQMREGQSYQQANPKKHDSSQVSKQGKGGATVATKISPQDTVNKYLATQGKYQIVDRDAHNVDYLRISVASPSPVF